MSEGILLNAYLIYLCKAWHNAVSIQPKGGVTMCREPIIRYVTVRLDKPVDELLASDIPRGVDPYDVCALNPDGTPMMTRKKPS